MDRYTLAALDPADCIDALHALWRAAHAQEAEWLGLSADTFAPLQVSARDLAFGSDTWLGCWDGGDLAGALAWGADDEDPRVQRIRALIVQPQQQRQGVATRLLHALFALSGPTPLAVHTAAGNEAALALYQGCGFRLVHRWLAPEGLRMVRLHKKKDPAG